MGSLGAMAIWMRQSTGNWILIENLLEFRQILLDFDCHSVGLQLPFNLIIAFIITIIYTMEFQSEFNWTVKL